MPKKMKTRKGKDGFDYPYTSPDIVIDENGKSATTKFNELSTQFKDIAKQLEQGGTGGGSITMPNNVALLEDVNLNEGEDYIPLFSSNGLEFKLTINDKGIPVIKNSENKIVFTCSGSSTGTGGTGGNTGSADDGDLTFGTPYKLKITNGISISRVGEQENTTDWSATDYTLCEGADYLEIVSAKIDCTFSAFYDINKKFIGQLINYQTGNIISVPSNAKYFRISLQTVAIESLTISPCKKSNTPNVTSGTPYSINLINNVYVNESTGIEKAYQNWSATDYLDCNAIDYIRCNIATQYNFFYTKNKQPVKGFNIVLDSTNNYVDIEVPLGAYYFRISKDTTTMNNLTVIPYKN